MNEVKFDPIRIYTGTTVRATLLIPYIYKIRMVGVNYNNKDFKFYYLLNILRHLLVLRRDRNVNEHDGLSKITLTYKLKKRNGL